MIKNALKLSKKLIAIKSISGNSKELDQALYICLSNLKGYTIEEFNKNGVKSALVYNAPKRPKKFKLIFNGHLDVFPGKSSLYRPKIVGDKLYGIGSMDMKSSLACLVTLFKELASKLKYPVALQIVTDEETGGTLGTKYQIEKGVRADFVICGETTNLNIVNEAKGILWLKIFNKGKSAHSAYPWLGKNAVSAMNSFLRKLQQKFPTPKNESKKSTISLSKIGTSNNFFNKIPDDCTAWLDVRYVKKEKTAIINKIKKLLPDDFGLTTFFEETPIAVSKNNLYVQKLKTFTKQMTNREVKLYQANGTSDLTHFAKANCQGIEFGPVGSNGNFDNEYVSIPGLKTYLEILKKFLTDLNRSKISEFNL